MSLVDEGGLASADKMASPQRGRSMKPDWIRQLLASIAGCQTYRHLRSTLRATFAKPDTDEVHVQDRKRQLSPPNPILLAPAIVRPIPMSLVLKCVLASADKMASPQWGRCMKPDWIRHLLASVAGGQTYLYL